jgi:hypothetical protein
MDPNTLPLPVHPYTGLTAIGYLKDGTTPIWPVMGGAPEDGEGDGEDVDDDAADGEDVDGDETEEEVVDWKAKHDELAAQFEPLTANLQRARAQAKKLREAAKATGVPAAAAPAVPAVKTVRQQAAATQVETPAVAADDGEYARLQGSAVRAYAKAALLAAGADPDLIDAPLSKLKAGDIDWDEDEDEPILDDYIEDMKTRYAKVFAKPDAVATAQRVGGRRPTGIDQGASNTGRAAPKELSFGEKLWNSGGGDPRANRRR